MTPDISYVTIDYLHWTRSGTGLTVPVNKSVTLSFIERETGLPIDGFGVMVERYIRSGFALNISEHIAPSAIFRIRRTDKQGYTVGANGERV